MHTHDLNENCLILKQNGTPLVFPMKRASGQSMPKVIDFATFHQEYQNWELMRSLGQLEKVQMKLKTFNCPLPELHEEDEEVKKIQDSTKKNMKSQNVL